MSTLTVNFTFCPADPHDPESWDSLEIESVELGDKPVQLLPNWEKQARQMVREAMKAAATQKEP